MVYIPDPQGNRVKRLTIATIAVGLLITSCGKAPDKADPYSHYSTCYRVALTVARQAVARDSRALPQSPTMGRPDCARLQLKDRQAIDRDVRKRVAQEETARTGREKAKRRATVTPTN